MKKEEVISQVQNSLGNLFTKVDVINCLNMVVEEKPKVEETKAGYPSKEWLKKIKNSILQRIKDVNFNDSDNFNIYDFRFEIHFENSIEVSSYEVDAYELKIHVENEIEDAFGEIEDEIIASLEDKEEVTIS